MEPLAMSAALESLMPPLRAQPATRSILLALMTFCGVGVSAALGFVVLSNIVLSVPTGLPRWLASALCYAAFIVPVYLLHRRFSFRSAAPHRQALPRYVAVQCVSLALATLFSYVTYAMVMMPQLPASVLVTALTSGVSFVVLRGWAFARS